MKLKNYDSPLTFIKDHYFKDTLALLVVFLSFNHVLGLCLLVSFCIASTSRNFMANCFITLFLFKKPNKKRDVLNQAVTSCGKKQSSPPTNIKSSSFFSFNWITLYFMIVELLVGFTLKYYGDRYFTIPIENLAMSIVASSFVNDPRDYLAYATSCSVFYALTTKLLQRIIIYFKFRGFFCTLNLLSYNVLVDQYQIIPIKLLKLFGMLPSLNKYYKFAFFTVSFHVVLRQFFYNMLKHSLLNVSFQPSLSYSTPNGSSTVTSNFLNTSQSIARTSTSSINSQLTVSHSNRSNPPSTLLNDKLILSSIVKAFKVSELSVTLPSQTNQQTVSTTTQLMDSTLDSSNLINQFYRLEVDSPRLEIEQEDILPSPTEENLENFIHQLFRWKHHYLIPPIWAIFTAIKPLFLEIRHLKSVNEQIPTDNDKYNSNNLTKNDSLNSLLSANNNCDNIVGSVFTKNDSNSCLTLIAPTYDDYHQLNLLSINDIKTPYCVCVIFIGQTSMTFRIDNLCEGELIVLVNGVIWSQISSATIDDKPFEEYTVVSGLVPSCSYDIQFVNRLHKIDYLIADFIVRTEYSSELDSSLLFSTEAQPLDFTFPSYYHRKFLSPILTLKHSILTTNTNLSGERTKLKKTKKEISKKINGLKQEIDNVKSKILLNVSQDEKSAFKLDNLKTLLQQSEQQIIKLEQTLKHFNEEDLSLKSDYLKKKDLYLNKQMEFDNLEVSLKKSLKSKSEKLNKLEQELQQLNSKKEKVIAKHDKLKKEIDQYTEDFINFRTQFLSQKEKDRQERMNYRLRETNKFELDAKGLEQDISRLEDENSKMHNIMEGY